MNEFPQSIEQKGAILQENGTAPSPWACVPTVEKNLILNEVLSYLEWITEAITEAITDNGLLVSNHMAARSNSHTTHHKWSWEQKGKGKMIILLQTKDSTAEFLIGKVIWYYWIVRYVNYNLTKLLKK